MQASSLFFILLVLFPGKVVLQQKYVQTPPLPVEDSFNWMGESNQELAEYGKSVGGAGDVNGDGYDDVLVGCHYYEDPDFHEGKVFLYYGSSTGIIPEPAWTFESDNANATLGISVSGAGDVNNDGYDDIIVGAHTYTSDQTNEGKVFVFYGSADGLSETPNWEAEGNQVGCDFGGCVSEAGDINNDGYDDVIIGAIFYDNGESDEGRAYVYYGSEFGLGSIPWTAELNQSGATFGSHVSGAGDVNGDGFDDVIIGCRKYTNGENAEGGAFVYLGASSGLSSEYAWHYESNLANTKLGQSVSGAGDINADGFSDIIISGHNYSVPEMDEGYAMTFLGSVSGLSDMPQWTHESNQTNALFGNQCSNAGDVNNDGYDDVIIGSREYTNGETSEGRAYVFYGSAEGLSDLSFWTAEVNQVSAFFGYSVAGAEDINGDGNDDVIVGAKYWDGGEIDEGAAFVYLGKSEIYPCTPTTSITFSAITSTSVVLSWDSVNAATNYHIVIKKANGSIRSYFTNNTTFTISDLFSDTRYKVIIRSKCGSQFSVRLFGGSFTTNP